MPQQLNLRKKNILLKIDKKEYSLKLQCRQHIAISVFSLCHDFWLYWLLPTRVFQLQFPSFCFNNNHLKLYIYILTINNM